MHLDDEGGEKRRRKKKKTHTRHLIQKFKRNRLCVRHVRFFFFFCALRAILHVEATYALWEEDGKKKNEVVDGMQKRNRAKLHTSARIAQISFYLFKHWVYVWSLFFFFYFVSLLASVSHRYFFFPLCVFLSPVIADDIKNCLVFSLSCFLSFFFFSVQKKELRLVFFFLKEEQYCHAGESWKQRLKKRGGKKKERQQQQKRKRQRSHVRDERNEEENNSRWDWIDSSLYIYIYMLF